MLSVSKNLKIEYEDESFIGKGSLLNYIAGTIETD